MIRNVDEWCQRAYEKTKYSTLPYRTQRYQDMPESARVFNVLSNRARFASCVKRRTGYLARVVSSDFAALRQATELTKEREDAMLDAWLRGVMWPPISVKAGIEDDRWVIKQARNADIALFLAGRQRLLLVQVFDTDKVKANYEELATLKAGLFDVEGGRCPVVSARITY